MTDPQVNPVLAWLAAHGQDSGSSLLRFLSRMTLIREFENRCSNLFRDALVRGAMHLCIGQEAVAVGAVHALRDDDYLSYTYRSHGWALARGVSPSAAFAEILGRESGTNLGRGGSKHIGQWSKGILPGNAIVGGHLPIAAGLAFACQKEGSGRITLAVFGEGATNQGSFHEAFSLASLWNLPIVFLCENNLYSELTPASVILPVENVSERVTGYGIPSMSCDGMDVLEVASTVEEACEFARNEGRAVFVEAMTYRFCGHHTGDDEKYRSKQEVDVWRERDPLDICVRYLEQVGVGREAIEDTVASARSEAISAEEAALESNEPGLDGIGLGTPDWMTEGRAERRN